MAVYQVEEYYISVAIDERKKPEIEELLSDEGYTNYQYNDGDLIVDDIESEEAGYSLEESVLNI
jgi:hypothetical protein